MRDDFDRHAHLNRITRWPNGLRMLRTRLQISNEISTIKLMAATAPTVSLPYYKCGNAAGKPLGSVFALRQTGCVCTLSGTKEAWCRESSKLGARST